MKSLSRIVALLTALCLGPLFAASIKVPMTPKLFGKQQYYEWTGTNLKSTQADTLFLYADTTTATLSGMDPLYLLRTEALSYHREARHPGDKPAEKVCLTVVGHADADPSDVKVTPQWHQTATGTYYRALQDTLSFVLVTAADHQASASFKADFAKFLSFKVGVTTATDSGVYQRFTVFPCDD
jgi:hypothetical protein